MMAASGRPFRGVLRGLSRHLGSVFTAVLAAPVVPDVAVDLLGVEGAAAALTRVGAVGVVALASVIVFAVESRVYRKRIRNVSARSTQVQRRDTLVLALSGSTQVRQPGERDDRPTAGEILLDTVRPRRVVLVSAPGGQSEQWLRTTRAALDQEHVESTTLSMRSPDSVEWLLEDLGREIERDRANGGSWDASSTLFDVTGGTVPMSLALLRMAATVGAECVYISSVHDRTGPRPGTQEPRQIDPKILIGGVTG